MPFMNTPTPPSGRLDDALTGSKVHPPAIASMASVARAAANDDTNATDDDHAVNPLWMITIALGILLGTMALLVATS
jgi:hypothetical protein